MSHPLELKIVALRRRVRRMAVVYGLSIAAAALLGTTAVLGWLDYLLRFQDRGLRIIASLAVLGVFGWTFYRYVVTALLVRLRDADLALRVQRRFPGLDDRLISAVEFLHAREDDPTAGSIALRRAVVAQTTTQAEPLDFSAVLDPRPTVRAAVLLMAACLTAGILVALAPLASRIAVARLVNPFGNAAWPQATHLAIRQPVDRVALGQAFQIEVVDQYSARLPPEVRIHYRFDGPDKDGVEETERMRCVEGAMVARRENVLRPFSYRVEGGDDQSMTWRDVQVVDPPAIESVSVRLIPPAYTGWPPAPSGRHIRALTGTSVQIAGKALKPLRSAILCIEGGKQIPAQLSDDGRAFTIGGGSTTASPTTHTTAATTADVGAAVALPPPQPIFTVEKSAAYWFALTDREGLSGGNADRWETVAIPDSPPTVSIEQPTANLFVMPAAVVAVRVAAKDDLAVRDVWLKFRRPESQVEETTLLWSGGPHPNPLPKGEGTLPIANPLPKGEGTLPIANPLPKGEGMLRIDYRWDLGPLRLKPGEQVTFQATATDYLPQTGASDPRSLTVIAAEELQDRLAAREQLILAELQRALRLERGCRTQVESLRARLVEPRPIGQAEVDLLQAVGHNQREADQVLTSRGEGVPTHVLALLADLENNRLQADDMGRRMSALLEKIDRIGREHLPAIGRELTAAAKEAQVEREGQGRGARSQRQVAASLAEAEKHQDAVIARLEQMLGRLEQWDAYRRFSREIGQLLRGQQDVGRRTAEVGRRTVTQELRDLAPQDVAELQAAAARQLELAWLLDRILQEMEQAGGELRESDLSAAKAVADALDHARRLATSGLMRTAGQQIEQNRIGQAAAGQKQISQDLQTILDILVARQAAKSSTSAARQPQPGALPASPGAARPTPDSSNGRTSGNQPANSGSSQPAGQRGIRKLDVEEIHAVMKRLWGQLPEQARQHILQAPVEQFPPKYELMIEEYYRRLAEDK